MLLFTLVVRIYSLRSCSPLHIVTELRPRHLETRRHPRHLETRRHPRHLVTELRPRHLVTELRPRHLVTELLHPPADIYFLIKEVDIRTYISVPISIMYIQHSAGN